MTIILNILAAIIVKGLLIVILSAGSTPPDQDVFGNKIKKLNE